MVMPTARLERERLVVADHPLHQPTAREHQRAQRDQRVGAREPSVVGELRVAGEADGRHDRARR